ncbi:hypothetical protein D3C81_892500 [compost metagenome]
MGHALGFADHRHDDISLLGRLDRFHQHRLRAARAHHDVGVVFVEIGEDFRIVGDVGALRVDQLCAVADGILHALQHAHRLLGLAGRRPTAHHVALAVGQRADHGDGALALQRQQVTVVLQQHHALARHLACRLAVQAILGVGVHRILALQVAVRIVEQAHLVLGDQYFATGAVDVALADLAGLHQRRQMVAVEVVVHVHVDAGLDRQLHRLALAGGDAVLDQLLHRAVVAQGQALVAPLLAQQVLQQPLVGAGRHAVDAVQRHHHRAGAGFDGRAVRRQVVLEHALRAHVDGVVVAAALARAIQGEVLDPGHDGARLVQAFALVGLDHYPGDPAGQPGVFAEAFGNPAPARVAGDVDGRREGQVEAVGAGFDGRHPRAFGDRFHIPAGGQAETDGEYRAVAVDHVVGEEQRDLQPALHGLVLQHADARAGHGVEHRAGDAGADLFLQYRLGMVGADTDQAQLADLLFEGHALHQAVDEGIPGLPGQRDGRFGGGQGSAGQRDGEAEHAGATELDRFHMGTQRPARGAGLLQEVWDGFGCIGPGHAGRLS